VGVLYWAAQYVQSNGSSAKRSRLTLKFYRLLS
jgi:hypothetical protein